MLSYLNNIFSWYITKRISQIEYFKNNPTEVQEKTLNNLLYKAKNTEIGVKYKFSTINNYSDFKNRIPLCKYDDIEIDIKRLYKGEENIFWPGKIKWFASSSGTTSGKSKLIPISKDSLIECHYKGGKDLLALYYTSNPKTQLFKGKHLILGGNTKLTYSDTKSYFGDLSAIIIDNLPWWCEWRRTPKKEITLLENWEEKIKAIAETSINDDVYILAGVPSWTLVLLNYILKQNSTDNINDIWPNLELYFHGGINFSPYKQQFSNIIQNSNMNYVQTYNATEGLFAVQDILGNDDMLLMLDYGIFYEFIDIEYLDIGNTILLEDVELEKQYAIIISSNTGLWRYFIGDTIIFTNLSPFRIKVIGRTHEHLNAFGEKLITDNTDKAIEYAMKETNSSLIEYSVAPIYMNNKNAGAHQWIVEFKKSPNNLEYFTKILDNKLKSLNSDYKIKRTNDLTLKKPLITIVKTDSFYKWMKNRNKLGGQNKVPRLSNSRKYIDEIIALS